MRFKPKAIALGVVGVFIFSMAAGDASELEDATYGYSSADGAEEFLAELEYMLEMLEEAEAKGVDKLDITPAVFTYNICWWIGKAKKLKELFEDNPDLAEEFKEIFQEVWNRVESLGLQDALAGLGVDAQFDGVGDFPAWYYYFSGNNDTYIDVEYDVDNTEGVASGEGWLNAEGNWVKLPILFNVKRGGAQRVYLSCHFDVRGKSTILPYPVARVIKLFFMRLYWEDAGEEESAEAFDTFDKFRFCKIWYCADASDPDACEWSCRWLLGLEPNVSDDYGVEDFEEAKWTRSPLLTLIPLRSEWAEYRSGEYFDHIVLTNFDRTVKFSDITVKLNDEPIFEGAVTVGPWSSIMLGVNDFRYSKIGLPTGEIPQTLRDMLEAAAHDIGQSWRVGCPSEEDKGGVFDECGYKWEYKEEYDGETINAWRPIYHEWCGDFVREMIRKYADGMPEPDADEHLWGYFGRIDPEHPGRYRISPVDINPETGEFYKWEDLATALKPGYAVSMSHRVGTDGRWDHQATFLKWYSDIYTPKPGSCEARFWVIAGNQSDSVNVRWFSIYNEVCQPPQTNRIWGADACIQGFCNFFGRTEMWGGK